MGTVLWMARRWNRDFAAPLGTSSVRRSLTCGVLLLVVSILGHVRSDREWTAVSGIELGPYRGDAVLRADPLLKGRAVYAVLELEGRRYDVWAYGPAGKRLSAHRFGETVRVEGVRTSLPDGTARRRHLRHVVGRFEVRPGTTSRLPSNPRSPNRNARPHVAGDGVEPCRRAMG
ncbi:MAG: hypothetical protein ACKO84_04245 [Actinomycetota bacterium]